MKPVRDVEAFCAVGKDGAIDIDLLRRSTSSAQYAVSNEKGVAWRQLATAHGWQIMRVRIVPAEAIEDDLSPPPIKLRRKKSATSTPIGGALLRVGS